MHTHTVSSYEEWTENGIEMVALKWWTDGEYAFPTSIIKPKADLTPQEQTIYNQWNATGRQPAIKNPTFYGPTTHPGEANLP